MKPSEYGAGPPTEASAWARMGAGSWTILIVLLSLLAITLVIVYCGWTSAKETDVPTAGYVAMVIGVIFSLAVGFGLMALVFYSSRKGYDEPPVLIVHPDMIEASRPSGALPEQ
jgi:hypothetical protein